MFWRFATQALRSASIPPQRLPGVRAARMSRTSATSSATAPVLDAAAPRSRLRSNRSAAALWHLTVGNATLAAHR
jgi:hypothetical protein